MLFASFAWKLIHAKLNNTTVQVIFMIFDFNLYYWLCCNSSSQYLVLCSTFGSLAQLTDVLLNSIYTLIKYMLCLMVLVRYGTLYCVLVSWKLVRKCWGLGMSYYPSRKLGKYDTQTGNIYPHKSCQETKWLFYYTAKPFAYFILNAWEPQY